MLDLASEQRIVLDPCSWETYERILSEHGDRTVPRFTYKEGALEIMSPSAEHEELSEAVKTVISIICEELGIEMRPLGSTTQRRPLLQKGVEPDASFFFGDVGRDARVDAPDLMVEVEISRPALDKMSIFAEMGVPEVWRCSPSAVSIHVLRDGAYHSSECSMMMPVEASAVASRLDAKTDLTRNEWLRSLRNWARGLASDRPQQER